MAAVLLGLPEALEGVEPSTPRTRASGAPAPDARVDVAVLPVGTDAWASRDLRP